MKNKSNINQRGTEIVHSDNFEPKAIINQVVIFLLLILCSSVIRGHHSNAEYNFEVTEEYVGEVVDVSWRNPHVRIWLRSTRQDGSEVVWDLEMLTANNLNRRGLSQEMIEIGETVRIAGHRSRRRDSIYMTNMLLPDGTEIRTRGDTEPRWSETNIGFTASSLNQDLYADDGSESIFRVWLPTERIRTSEHTDLPLTASARAVKSSWDSVTDDPQIGCNPIGMPEAMYSPNPIQFIRNGEDITLRLEEWDHVRSIFMTSDTSLHDQQATILGYSVGDWEDNTLVVRTTNIDYPWMDYEGTPQTEAAVVTERFVLSEDERSLDWEATVNDAGTLTEPVLLFTAHYEWAPEVVIQSYNCAVL
ncbi:MAG: hypothetical protein CMM56_08585 [Rhodospirillaceae bacterium]|nr:hypothetical protein [Rhodospirillaceae bacterium]